MHDTLTYVCSPITLYPGFTRLYECTAVYILFFEIKEKDTTLLIVLIKKKLIDPQKRFPKN